MTDPTPNLPALRDLLLKHVGLADLRTFCFDIGVEYEDIVSPTDTLSPAIITVIQYFKKHGRLMDLIATAKGSFPQADWPAIDQAIPQPAAVTDAKPARASGPLRIFLCYASEDKATVREVHTKLKASGMSPWLDEDNLLPGQKWKVEISKAIERSDVVLVCLSQRSVQKNGYVKGEIKSALDLADKRPDDDIRIIPLRLENCEVPERLGEIQWVNWFDAGGYESLLRSLNAKAKSLGIEAIAGPTSGTSVVSVSSPKPKPIAQANPDRWVIESPIHLELVRVSAGKFLMGSDPAKDKKAYVNEQPQHWVHLSEYYIGKAPVTNVQYAAFAKAKNLRFEIPKGEEQHPVGAVSWRDAVAFCEWLSAQTQQTFTLPTEAQWEKAARGTDGRIYPWGNDFDAQKCNTIGGVIRDTTSVGKYSPLGDSPYGCVDMIGNIWEWCLDSWDAQAYTKRASKNVADPQNLDSNVRKVVRGGSWTYYGSDARAAIRNDILVVNRHDFFGIRVVCSAPLFSALVSG